MDLRWINGAMVGAALGLLAMSTTLHEARVTAPDEGRLAALENRVARAPEDVSQRLELTQAYLEAAQPGMALAALAQTSPDMQRTPEIAHALARALFQDGRTREALVTELSTLDSCAESSCRPRLVAQAARRVEFFRAVLDLGIENPLSSPEAVTLAYTRSNREVRLEAQ
jgi:hypothetical protein